MKQIARINPFQLLFNLETYLPYEGVPSCVQDWANIHCKYISYYLLRAKSENEICLPIQIESNLNICVTERIKEKISDHKVLQ